jgi:hypothetical protein
MKIDTCQEKYDALLPPELDDAEAATLDRLDALDEKEVNRVGIDFMVKGEGNKLENLKVVLGDVRS